MFIIFPEPVILVSAQYIFLLMFLAQFQIPIFFVFWSFKYSVLGFAFLQSCTRSACRAGVTAYTPQVQVSFVIAQLKDMQKHALFVSYWHSILSCRSCGRGSPKRQILYQKAGHFQVFFIVTIIMYVTNYDYVVYKGLQMCSFPILSYFKWWTHLSL